MGYDLLMDIYELIKSFPKIEQFALASQLIRSANSVIANIAEAHGRFYFQDKIRVLYISRAEVEETQSHIRVAVGRGYITKEKGKKLDDAYEALNRKINSYIKFLFEKSR